MSYKAFPPHTIYQADLSENPSSATISNLSVFYCFSMKTVVVIIPTCTHLNYLLQHTTTGAADNNYTLLLLNQTTIPPSDVLKPHLSATISTLIVFYFHLYCNGNHSTSPPLQLIQTRHVHQISSILSNIHP
uniref:Putative ovule protein n=1 Tax=Solanum chacoense TaxID=4108 RepID=A0A0V0ILJ9_SOLCH